MSPRQDKLAARLWVHLAKCYALVLREVRKGQAESPASLAQFDVLAQLLRNPDGMSVGELSKTLLVTAGNVTGLVDRMSRRGWVTRQARADDQRVRIVRLTTAGQAVARSEVQRQEAMLQTIFGGLSLSRQRELAQQLDQFRRILETDATCTP